MAAVAEGDDVYYSHMLTKLFRVDVERASSDAQARQRALARAASAHSARGVGREPSAFTGGLQVRGCGRCRRALALQWRQHDWLGFDWGLRHDPHVNRTKWDQLDRAPVAIPVPD